jgi:hypothetical protein
MQPQHGQFPLPGEVELGRRCSFGVALLAPGPKRSDVAHGGPAPASDRVGCVGGRAQACPERKRRKTSPRQYFRRAACSCSGERRNCLIVIIQLVRCKPELNLCSGSVRIASFVRGYGFAGERRAVEDSQCHTSSIARVMEEKR